MTIDVFFSPAVVDEASVEGRPAVVIDVIRATSTLVEALANGARAIIPTVSTEEAVRLASSLGVMTTTNGTRAFAAVEGADRVLAASFMNLSAVAEALDGVPSLVIACAGRENRFSLDDALCAGMLIRSLQEGREEETELNDAGRVAADLASKYRVDAEFLRSTAAGKALIEVGLDGDLELCASLDRHALVPEMRERRISIPSQAGQAPGSAAGT